MYTDFHKPMYALSENELEIFLNEELHGNPDGWSFSLSNIYEFYLKYRQKAFDLGKIYIILGFSIVSLLIFTDIAILKSYLFANKQEIAVKLSLGHSKISILRKIILLFAVGYFAVLLGEYIYFAKYISDAKYYTVIGFFIVCVPDILITANMMNKYIVKRMSKTLKGGAL